MSDIEKEFIKPLGERVARLRRGKGWKQRELAPLIGCSGQQVCKLERGQWPPRIDVLVRTAHAFDVTLDYLLTGRGPLRPEADLRFRERLPALEGLPRPLRDGLIDFLDALVLANRCFKTPLAEGEDGPASDWAPQGLTPQT